MKKIVLFMFLLFPIFSYASCNYEKINEYNKLATNIDYEMIYNYNTQKYVINFYNMYEKLSVMYNGKIYMPNSKNEVIIKNIDEGKYLDIKVYAPVSECDSFIKTISITTKYYNSFYNSEKCRDYKNILNICKEEFLTYKPTIELLNHSIDNYENAYREKEQVDFQKKSPEPTILNGIKEFAMKWGIQLLLGIISSIITITIFKVRFRKIKHGI